jgi:F-type H+-transporting ATPase subunit gamma
MATTREIRRHIRSIKNISQVTRAMEMVSASKMMRAQSQVISARPYADKTWEILTHLACLPTSGQLHPLLEQRPIRRVGLVVLTSDRGLCGGLNNNVIRLATQFILGQENPVRVVAAGKTGRDALARLNVDIIAEFTKLPDPPSYVDVTPIARVTMDDFVGGEVDRVHVAFNRFVNTLTQESTFRTLLPLTSECGVEEVGREYIYEPDPDTLLDELLPRFTEDQIYQMVLESLASEHSARMVAMRNANENANEMIADLTFTFNQVRQTAITREMLEIAAGAAALEREQHGRGAGR